MNKYRNTDKDIHKRIYHFVAQCFVNIVKALPKTVENRPIIEQLSASLTSIGANDHEADAAVSRKDFIAKYVIVRKEARETEYWLSLIRDGMLIDKKKIEPYLTECEEIRKIVSSIIDHSRR